MLTPARTARQAETSRTIYTAAGEFGGHPEDDSIKALFNASRQVKRK
jgi:hypothetical protein